MRYQTVTFKRTPNHNWETGIAALKIFGLSNVEHIIDNEGNKLDTVEDYYLSTGPLSHIDTEYEQ